MEMIVELPGGARVDARLRHHLIRTDQPRAAGGEDAAPSPFELFLSSIGTCAGIYVSGFCRQRGIPTDGIRIVQSVHRDTLSGMVGEIDLRIELPSDFPGKYVDAVVRAADQCTVKKHLEHPPRIRVASAIAAGTDA